MRLFAGPRTVASAPYDAALNSDTFGPPSVPPSYSSFVPTTISGRWSAFKSATAGVSTIAPWLSAGPALDLKCTTCERGSTESTFDASTTSTGKPFT
jgi:hypothetical protein